MLISVRAVRSEQNDDDDAAPAAAAADVDA